MIKSKYSILNAQLCCMQFFISLMHWTYDAVTHTHTLMLMLTHNNIIYKIDKSKKKKEERKKKKKIDVIYRSIETKIFAFNSFILEEIESQS